MIYNIFKVKLCPVSILNIFFFFFYSPPLTRNSFSVAALYLIMIFFFFNQNRSYLHTIYITLPAMLRFCSAYFFTFIYFFCFLYIIQFRYFIIIIFQRLFFTVLQSLFSKRTFFLQVPIKQMRNSSVVEYQIKTHSNTNSNNYYYYFFFHFILLRNACCLLYIQQERKHHGLKKLIAILLGNNNSRTLFSDFTSGEKLDRDDR